MNSINRAAIVVRPKTPFFDWARTLEGGLPESTEPWCSVYLVKVAKDADLNKVLRRYFAAIFEEQLGGWWLDMNDWPAKRTFAVFQKWFDARVVDLVLDLAAETIEHDD